MIIELRQGDTLWYYSLLFQIPLQLIIDSNPQLEPQNLTPGTQVLIPGYTANDYTIRQGDSFWALANRFGLALDMLLVLNSRIDPRRLYPGLVVQLPHRVTELTVQLHDRYAYSHMQSDLARLKSLYPFLRLNSIGPSVMGKEIPQIQIGHGAKKVHVNASFHANEWITTPVLMRFLNEYLIALTNQASIRGLAMLPYYTSVTLSLVPMVNPDGVDLVVNGAPAQQPYRDSVLAMNSGSGDFSGWKANIRGVDLNNQFPALWELEAERKPKVPGPRDYPGEAPLTEPESIAMAELTERESFARVIALHTQGEVIYFGFEQREPPEADTIVREFARVSGYIPIRHVDSYAGYKDWFIYEWRRPGFTVELGRGVNPLPWSQFPEIYERTLGILLANLYM